MVVAALVNAGGFWIDMKLNEKIKSAIPLRLSLQRLLLKSAIFSLSWFFLPFWLFLIPAFYFYFFPLFNSKQLALPFFLTLLAAAILPQNFWFSLFFGILLYLIIGIKNLLFVNRSVHHQFLVFLLLFLIFYGFFSGFESWQRWDISLWALGPSLVFLFLVKELADYNSLAGHWQKNLIIGLASFIIWQLSLAIFFLPLNYFYATALLFLVAVLLADILLEYFDGHLARQKILVDFSIFFVLAVIILASSKWVL